MVGLELLLIASHMLKGNLRTMPHCRFARVPFAQTNAKLKILQGVKYLHLITYSYFVIKSIRHGIFTVKQLK